MDFVYFGFDSFDAYMNMAIDELLWEKTTQEKTYIRFYDFERPSIILSYTQHPSEIMPSSDMDATRRLSDGGAILCDNSSLAYSMTINPEDRFNVQHIHKILGTRIAEVVKEYTNEPVSIGDHFSVRINNKIVAGHGQRNGSSTLYHGVLAVYPWRKDTILSSVVMEPDEMSYIMSLPCIHDYSKDVKKETIASEILDSATEGKWVNIDNQEKNNIINLAVSLAAKKYRNPRWIDLGYLWDREDGDLHRDNLQKGWGFCFADIKSPEPISTRI